jgi:YHS domain-containing protein
MFRAMLIASILLLIGCAQEHQSVIHASAQGHSECLVCKRNADLACVDVAVTDQTPVFDYKGRRYFFCSDDCRNEFAKNPQKYIAP